MSAPESAGHFPHSLLRDGPVAGLIGSFVIAGFLAVWSMSLGQSPFHVAALLGRTLFFDGADTGPGAAPVLAYTAAHTATLALAGTLLALTVRRATPALRAWVIGGVATLLCAAHVAVLPVWFGSAVRDALPLWIVASATGLGLLAMSEYLWQRSAPAATAVTR